MPVPAPVAADATGLPDSNWILDVRRRLRDYPKYTTEVWTADGSNAFVGFTGAPLTVAKPAINHTVDPTGVFLSSSLQMRNNTINQNYTVIVSGSPSGTQVLVNHDTGEMQFNSAPVAGNALQYSYQLVRWTDADIISSLYAGLRLMFPRVGKTYVGIEIPIQVNVWDYTLPSWCQTPGSRLSMIEIADPFIPTEPFRPAPAGIRRVGLGTLHLPWSQRYSPTARLRISGWGPYLALGDLEPHLFALPTWYAVGTLLAAQESKRIREDTMVSLAQIGGQQPSLLLQTGDYFIRKFDAELDAQKRTIGPTLPWPSMYQAGYRRPRY